MEEIKLPTRKLTKEQKILEPTIDEQKMIWDFLHKLSNKQKDEFKRSGLELDDLYQELCMNLEKIREKFNPQKSKYSTFFYLRLQQILLRKKRFLTQQKRYGKSTFLLSDNLISEFGDPSFAKLTPDPAMTLQVLERRFLGGHIRDKIFRPENPFNLTAKGLSDLRSHLLEKLSLPEYGKKVGISTAAADARFKQAVNRIKREIVKTEKV